MTRSQLRTALCKAKAELECLRLIQAVVESCGDMDDVMLSLHRLREEKITQAASLMSQRKIIGVYPKKRPKPQRSSNGHGN
jgi:hypothetical protein